MNTNYKQLFEQNFSADALYLTAFELFDVSGTHSVSFPEFERIIKHSEPLMEIPYNFDSTFIKRYFGVCVFLTLLGMVILLSLSTLASYFYACIIVSLVEATTVY